MCNDKNIKIKKNAINYVAYDNHKFETKPSCYHFVTTHDELVKLKIGHRIDTIFIFTNEDYKYKSDSKIQLNKFVVACDFNEYKGNFSIRAGDGFNHFMLRESSIFVKLK